tara:strand:- start:61 stop:321 length:261 start_codon:yes stop_codon:yes gene_type:complete
MAITERTEVDRREILVDGTIQVRTARIVERDGKEISRTFINRQVFHPGMDVSKEDECVQRIAAIEHTPQCIANFKTKEAERESKNK